MEGYAAAALLVAVGILTFNLIFSRGDEHLTSIQIQELDRLFRQSLTAMGLQPPYPELRDICLVLMGSVIALITYYFTLGRRHRRRREEITHSLICAREKVRRLESELKAIEEMEEDDAKKGKPGRKIRIFMEGAFDLTHYGHVNAFRLGRSLGHELVVGVNSSSTITQCKGPPVMTDEERCTMVSSCRFVDEVISGIPYVMTEDYLLTLMEKYRIDYVVHGDDPVIVDGKDVYAHVKKMGKYKSIPRTEGVSTTDIVGRMLLCNSRTLARKPVSRFMTTSSILTQFRGGMEDPEKDAKIVYIDGDWDMFCARHVNILREAKALGDFLIVGVHNDDLVQKKSCQSGNLPIMDLHERVLSVMGCKYVSDVLLDAPWSIGRDMIKSLRLSVIVGGPRYIEHGQKEDEERYGVAKELKIFQGISSSTSWSPVHDIVKRIQENRQRFQEKIRGKHAKEVEYYKKRYGRV